MFFVSFARGFCIDKNNFYTNSYTFQRLGLMPGASFAILVGRLGTLKSKLAVLRLLNSLRTGGGSAATLSCGQSGTATMGGDHAGR